MRRSNATGYVMILTLLCLSLVGMAIVILAAVNSDMVFESNRAYAEASHRNLTASALAWADQNRDKLSETKEAGIIPLDIETLKVPDGAVTIEPIRKAERPSAVKVSARCSRGAFSIVRSKIYFLNRGS